MLVEDLGLKSFFSRGTDNESGDLSATVHDVELIPFIEGYDE